MALGRLRSLWIGSTRRAFFSGEGGWNEVIEFGRLQKVIKHPGGWEAALAVEHALKKSGTVAPCAFHESYFYTFSRGKSSNVEVVAWYLQGFVALE